eukprot:s3841_g12.t1
MSRLPHDLHGVTPGRSPDNAIHKKHATQHVQSAAPATKSDDGHLQSVRVRKRPKTDQVDTQFIASRPGWDPQIPFHLSGGSWDEPAWFSSISAYIGAEWQKFHAPGIRVPKDAASKRRGLNGSHCILQTDTSSYELVEKNKQS